MIIVPHTKEYSFNAIIIMPDPSDILHITCIISVICKKEFHCMIMVPHTKEYEFNAIMPDPSVVLQETL